MAIRSGPAGARDRAVIGERRRARTRAGGAGGPGAGVAPDYLRVGPGGPARRYPSRRRERSRATACAWSWQTRDSDTSSTAAISLKLSSCS